MQRQENSRVDILHVSFKSMNNLVHVVELSITAEQFTIINYWPAKPSNEVSFSGINVDPISGIETFRTDDQASLSSNMMIRRIVSIYEEKYSVKV